MTSDTNIDTRLRKLEVEFLHGVPVKLPESAIAQIKQLIADECSLERKRHVLIEGALRQELNEIKNAVRVLAALQGEGDG